MITFDDIIPTSLKILRNYTNLISEMDWLVLNRDLNGRIRLIAPDSALENNNKAQELQALNMDLSRSLINHYHTADIIYENNVENLSHGTNLITLGEFTNVFIADRFVNESSWNKIAPVTSGVPRIVFFSIKGGVGRSTSLAATAWHLAQKGLKVLVIDLDLESPGLSSTLLPPDRQPKYGITDWLVEDLVDNTDGMIDSMISISPLSNDGEIYVVPAHGVLAGEYVSKLGRVWMPKINTKGIQEKWSDRLKRLIDALERKTEADIILIDSRSGIDEVASCCVTDLGASLILLFALDGQQTWNGYRILFHHWLQCGLASKIRERLQIVAALVPEIDKIPYLISLRENAYDIFSDNLYDEIKAPSEELIGEIKAEKFTWSVREIIEGWNFDSADETAPHSPWPIQWHRSFTGSLTLHGRLASIDQSAIDTIFGPLISGVFNTLESGETNE